MTISHLEDPCSIMGKESIPSLMHLQSRCELLDNPRITNNFRTRRTRSNVFQRELTSGRVIWKLEAETHMFSSIIHFEINSSIGVRSMRESEYPSTLAELHLHFQIPPDVYVKQCFPCLVHRIPNGDMFVYCDYW